MVRLRQRKRINSSSKGRKSSIEQKHEEGEAELTTIAGASACKRILEPSIPGMYGRRWGEMEINQRLLFFFSFFFCFCFFGTACRYTLEGLWKLGGIDQAARSYRSVPYLAFVSRTKRAKENPSIIVSARRDLVPGKYEIHRASLLLLPPPRYTTYKTTLGGGASELIAKGARGWDRRGHLAGLSSFIPMITMNFSSSSPALAVSRSR